VFQEIWVGNIDSASANGQILVPDRHQVLPARNRHRFEQRRVDQREDHSVEADPERERYHDGSREPAVGGNHAQGEAEILNHKVEYGDWCRIVPVGFSWSWVCSRDYEPQPVQNRGSRFPGLRNGANWFDSCKIARVAGQGLLRNEANLRGRWVRWYKTVV